MTTWYSTGLSEAQWERVCRFVEKSFGRPAQVKWRRIVNAILSILRAGCRGAYCRASFRIGAQCVLLAMAT